MKHLKWNESASYIWARSRHFSGPAKWWVTHAIFAGTAVGLFALAEIAKFFRGGTSQMTIWQELAICVGVGFVFGYFVPIMTLLSAARIWTNDRGLHRKRLEGGHVLLETWPWERIAGYSIKRVIYNGKAFDELHVNFKGGGEVWFGLDGKQLQSQFEEVFRTCAGGATTKS